MFVGHRLKIKLDVVCATLRFYKACLCNAESLRAAVLLFLKCIGNAVLPPTPYNRKWFWPLAYIQRKLVQIIIDILIFSHKGATGKLRVFHGSSNAWCYTNLYLTFKGILIKKGLERKRTVKEKVN